VEATPRHESDPPENSEGVAFFLAGIFPSCGGGIVEKGLLKYSSRFVNLRRKLILPPFLSFSVGIEASSGVGLSVLYPVFL
jgi:hypothetical protein